MNNPYKVTELNTRVCLLPRYLNNEIDLHIKKNIINDLEKKCYKDYGYIAEVLEVTKLSDGYIRAENLRAESEFEVNFACKICKPVKDDTLTFKIERVTKLLIKAINGPVNVFITPDRINDDAFFFDNNRNIHIRMEDGKSKMLQENDFVIINIHNINFKHGDTIINATGFMNKVASEDEIKEFYKQQI